MPHRIESPFSFRLAEKITGVPGGTVPVRYGEARGIFSFEKRMSPRPPKEKRGGDFDFPPHPLETTQRGGLRPSPLETPLRMRGSGSGERSRGCPLCDPTNAMPANAGTHSGHLGTFSAAGRRLLIFVGSSYRPLLRMGELTQMCQLIPDIFSFPPCTAHFLFDVSKRKWGVHPHGKTVYSRAAKWHHAASPAAVRRAPLRGKENVGDIPMGKAHFRIRSRMVSPCFPVPHSGTL